MNTPPFYLVEVKIFINFVIFSICIQQKVKNEWIFVISMNRILRKTRSSVCIFSIKICEVEGLRTSPGGLAAVRFEKLFPFSFAVRRNLFAMEVMAYGCSSTNTIPSIFTTLLHGNKKHWAVVSAPWLSLPSYTEGWLFRKLWSGPRHQASACERG